MQRLSEDLRILLVFYNLRAYELHVLSEDASSLFETNKIFPCILKVDLQD